jgi:predicted DNA-binding transcriptional regulator AlpA
MAKRENYYETAVAKVAKFHGIKLLTVGQTLDLIEAAGLPRPEQVTLTYQWKRGRFPKPFRIGIGRLTAYKEIEVRDWLKNQRQLVRVDEVA